MLSCVVSDIREKVTEGVCSASTCGRSIGSTRVSKNGAKGKCAKEQLPLEKTPLAL